MGGPGRLARKAIATLRRGGPRALFWQALAVAGVRRLAVYCFPFDEEVEAAAPAGVSIRTLSQADVGAYRNARPETSRRELERRLGTGELCVAAWREERLIAGYWMAPREARVAYLGLSIPLAADAWFGHDVFVAPDERGRGILTAVRAEALRRGRAEGAAVLVGAVLPDNRAGRGLVRRWRRLGTLFSVRVGPLRLTRSSVPARYLGEPHFSDASRHADDVR